jgi:adenine-specific DNA-methyltransferase
MNDYARELRNNATEAEELLWRHLRGRQLNGFKFRRQRPIGKYVCDFVCLEAGLIVELDGSRIWSMNPTTTIAMHHLGRSAIACCASGTGRVFSETEAVVETIFQALHRPEMDGRFD